MKPDLGTRTAWILDGVSQFAIAERPITRHFLSLQVPDLGSRTVGFENTMRFFSPLP